MGWLICPEDEFKITEKYTILSNKPFFQSFLLLFNKFRNINKENPNVLCIGKKRFINILNRFIQYQQLEIRFEEEKNKNNDIIEYPCLKIKIYNGKKYKIKLKCYHTYYYLNIIYKNLNAELYLQLNCDLNHNEILLKYEPYYDKKMPVEIYDAYSQYYDEEGYSSYYKTDKNIYKEIYKFNINHNILKTIAYAVDDFLYKVFSFPNIFLVCDKTQEAIETLNNQRRLNEINCNINSGMLTYVDIKINNEETIELKINGKQNKKIYIYITEHLAEDEFALVYDEDFTGRDDNNDDYDTKKNLHPNPTPGCSKVLVEI